MVAVAWRSWVICVLTLATAMVGAALIQPAVAETMRSSVSIANNSGGSVAAFVQHARALRASGTQVRFTGRCDSACTLLMALPAHQTCITRGAYFRFHAPVSGDPRMTQLTHRYMMMKYPSWVRAFIQKRGGLTSQLVRMDYDYASRFMRSCGSPA